MKDLDRIVEAVTALPKTAQAGVNCRREKGPGHSCQAPKRRGMAILRPENVNQKNESTVFQISLAGLPALLVPNVRLYDSDPFQESRCRSPRLVTDLKQGANECIEDTAGS